MFRSAGWTARLLGVKRTTAIAAIFLMLVCLMGCHTSGPQHLDKHIDNLTAGASNAQTDAALRAIKSAGAAGFPALVHHLDDPRKSKIQFLGDVSTTEPPTVGQVCFDLLQMQIEPAWPKSYRDFHALTPDNAAQWVKAHEGQTLGQMRSAALAESLSKAESALARDPSNKWLQDTVRFLRHRQQQESS